MSKTPSFASIATASEDAQQNTEFHSEINKSDLLTKEEADPFGHNNGRKSANDEIVMVGVRMTKRHRKNLIHMATEMDITMQEVVRRALSEYRKQMGLRM